ncbi:tRNA pseudouridine(55) synthase TruB [Haliangium ochraceum]|uniref:tRNA pseudouridine synthase B n=1 Tax=Haliangium ochraceum (strain DSM 14365 / JCM 11303 / SMP-2) TaxID=502025 RepID=D0LZ86_HALO1|nr:tRNA pseudouridine(55) synthase TruB [Haliangium ochraceum]ACY16348.1 tRNA pseudouridine synthase B [Haliangium ochraceum DSM 14365]
MSTERSSPEPEERRRPARDAASGQGGANKSALHGVLVVDKPAGITSAAVVARVKRHLGVRRVGHTGTLDPMATGVLPLCLGEATKIAGYLLAEDKGYEAELLLGVETDTLDAEGQVTARAPEAAAAVDEAALRRVLATFVGPGEQVPPMFSALKRGGKRLHELARAGQEVERPPRPVVIHELLLHAFATPRARFSVHCSKGTYVRSLADDIGRALGCGAHLSALRRTRSGAFAIAQAIPLAAIEDDPERARAALVSPAVAVAHLPAVAIPSEGVHDIACGKPMSWQRLSLLAPEAAAIACDAPVRLLLPSGELVALAERVATKNAPDMSNRGADQLHYLRGFSYDLTNRAASSNLSGSSGRERARQRRSER